MAMHAWARILVSGLTRSPDPHAVHVLYLAVLCVGHSSRRRRRVWYRRLARDDLSCRRATDDEFTAIRTWGRIVTYGSAFAARHPYPSQLGGRPVITRTHTTTTMITRTRTRTRATTATRTDLSIARSSV